MNQLSAFSKSCIQTEANRSVDWMNAVFLMQGITPTNEELCVAAKAYTDKFYAYSEMEFEYFVQCLECKVTTRMLKGKSVA